MEIGRLLRPDTFNPVLRAQRNEADEDEDEEEISQKESQTGSIPSTRSVSNLFQGLIMRLK